MFRFAQHDSAITRWDGKRCVGVRDDGGKMAAAFNDCERTCVTNT
jgi:hypothetical protein